MVQPRKKKAELVLANEEVASFLRHLADEMEKGGLTLGDTEMDLDNFTRLSVSMKSLGEKARVQVKVKYPRQEPLDYVVEYQGPGVEEGVDEGQEDGPDGNEAPGENAPRATEVRPAKPKYKRLKKEMKRQFKAIRARLAMGELPDEPLVRVFAHNSRLMCTYAGKGDEFYAAYNQAVDRFLTAVVSDSVQEASARAEELDRIKRDCHDRHK